MASVSAEDVLGHRGKPRPRVQKVDFAAVSTGDCEVVENPSQPDRRGGRAQHAPGVGGLIDRPCHFLKFDAIQLPAGLAGVEDRQSSKSAIADSNQKSTRKIDAEDVQPDSFRDRAVDEGVGDRKTRHPGEHEFKVHGVRMEAHLLDSSQSMLVEDGFVKMGEKSVDASGFKPVAPTGQMGDSTSNAMGDRVDSRLGFLWIGLGSSMSAEGEDRINEIPKSIEFGEGGAVSRGPVGHGDCEETSVDSS